MRDGGEAHGGNGGGRCRFRVMQPLCSRSSLSIYPYLQMPVCDYFWQCLVAQIAQAWRRAEAEPAAPGSHPRFGCALLLDVHVHVTCACTCTAHVHAHVRMYQ